MNLILKGRGVDLNDRLRGYATEKLTKVERFFGRIIKMEVELSSERNPRVRDQHRVDVTVQTKGETLRAHGAGADHFAAIDQAADRLEVQVKKHKGRRTARPHRPVDANGEAAAEAVMPVDDEGPVIVRMTQSPAKPMTAEEAVLELEARGLAFLLFTGAETLAPSVVYRRSDGTFGLIEYEA